MNITEINNQYFTYNESTGTIQPTDLLKNWALSFNERQQLTTSRPGFWGMVTVHVKQGDVVQVQIDAAVNGNRIDGILYNVALNTIEMVTRLDHPRIVASEFNGAVMALDNVVNIQS